MYSDRRFNRRVTHTRGIRPQSNVAGNTGGPKCLKMQHFVAEPNQLHLGASQMAKSCVSIGKEETT